MEAIEFLKEASRICKNQLCNKCPVKGKCLYNPNINQREDKMEEIVSAVEQWSKVHPMVTNRMKIREVFGDESMYTISSPNMQALIDWLDEPYKEP